MAFNTFVSSSEDIQQCLKATNLKEVLIEPELLAREGRLTLIAAQKLAEEAKSHGLRAVLVWDILMTEEDFSACRTALNTISLAPFSAIRVQCIGAARFLKEQFPSVKIQLIAETANCNLRTLQLWCSLLAEHLERIILSIQLPAEKIAEFVAKLPVPCEILALGRILLFYSRRNLLKKNFGDLGESWREVVASSEESHERPFPIVDNTHGTFMYLDKDQFILHKLSDLGEQVPEYLRLDLRHCGEFPISAATIDTVTAKAVSNPQELRDSWFRPTIAPFFKSNLTTKQFKFLNSELRFSRDRECLAEVVSSERERHTVLRVVEPFSLPVRVKAIDPNGSETILELKAVKSLAQKEVLETAIDQIVLAPWFRKATIGSLLVRY